jgi:hypothetical protein
VLLAILQLSVFVLAKHLIEKYRQIFCTQNIYMCTQFILLILLIFYRNKNMNIYCNIDTWIKEHNPEFAKLKAKLCLRELYGKTFINPTKAQVASYVKLSKTKDKAERKNLNSMIRSHYLNVDLHSKNFVPGKYATLNNNATVEISAPTSGVFTIKSGKDLKSVYKVKINNTFEPEWKYKVDEDKDMCVVDFVSGDINYEGTTLTGISQPHAKHVGGSEYVENDTNKKLLNWGEVTGATYSELKHKTSVVHAAVTCAGLLQFLLDNREKIPEYNDVGKIVHVAMCCEPFAMWYILVQPFSSHGMLPNRLITEWEFAPCVHPDFCALWEEFAQAFPTNINCSQRTELVGNIREMGGGKFSIDELRETYETKCNSLFSHIPNFPCEQKLWADELCFYICDKMQKIRQEKDLAAFKELCDTLKNQFPGKNHKEESIIASELYWKKVANDTEKDKMQVFIESFCCLKCTHCADDKLSHACNETLRELSGRKLSNRLKNTIRLNSRYVD